MKSSLYFLTSLALFCLLSVLDMGSAGAADGTWVLTATRHEDAKEAMAAANARSDVYHVSGSYKNHDYTMTTRYIGKDDSSTGARHGEHAAYQLLFTAPPSRIRPGETLGASLTLKPLNVDLHFFDFKAYGYAQLGNIRLTNAKGQGTFELSRKKGHSKINDKVTIEMPKGSQGAEQELSYSMTNGSIRHRTIYVYRFEEGQ